MMSVVELRMQIHNIAEARKALGDVNNDTERLKQKMKEFGIPARDAKLLMAQLNKELNQSRRDVLGITAAAKPLPGELAKSVMQSRLLQGALAAVGKTLDVIKNLGKVKTIEEMTADAIKLEKQIIDTRDAMKMSAEEAITYYQNLKAASVASNIPMPVLDKAVNKVQTKDTELARRLVLENNGAGLMAIANATAASKSDDPIEGVFARAILQKNLPALDTTRGMEIIRSGEQAGAASAEMITTKMGGSISRHATSRGFNVNDPKQAEAALREGQAIAQLIASGRGVDKESEAATIFENYEGHIGRSKTRKDFKEHLGVDTLDKTGHVKSMDQLLDEIYARQQAGKIKPTALADAAPDEQFKRSIEIGLDAATPTKTPGQVLRGLRDVDPETGKALMGDAFKGIFESTEGQLQQSAIQAEAKSYEDLARRKGIIIEGARKATRVNAQMPLTGAAISAVGGIPYAGPAIQGAAYAVVGAGDIESAPDERARLLRERNEMIAGQRRNAGLDSGPGGAPSKIEITNVFRYESDMQGKIVQEAVSSRVKAAGGGQRPKLPGRR
jgi:hypothetical protein